MTANTEAQLLRDVAEIKELLIRREACQQKCEKVHDWAFGNGEQGADDSVRWLIRREKARDQWSNKLWGMLPAVVSGVAVGIVVLGVQWVAGLL